MAISRTIALGAALIVAAGIGTDCAYAFRMNVGAPIVPTHVAPPTKSTVTVIQPTHGRCYTNDGRTHCIGGGLGGGHHPGGGPHWIAR
jgi:hypothetical protein